MGDAGESDDDTPLNQLVVEEAHPFGDPMKEKQEPLMVHPSSMPMMPKQPLVHVAPPGGTGSFEAELHALTLAISNFDDTPVQQVRALKFCLLLKERCFESCERGVFIVVSLCFILGMGCGVAGVRIRYERCVHDQVQESGCRALQKPEKHQPLQMKQVSADQV